MPTDNFTHNANSIEDKNKENTKGSMLYDFFVFCLSASGVMGLSFIMPILPDIERAFNISPTSATMLISVYTLPGLIVSLLCGILAEKIGRKYIVFIGIICFTFGGLLCSEAQSFKELLLYRALQGIGGGVSAAMYATLIADRYTGLKLTKMMGRASFVIGVNTALLPLIGGYLGEISWNSPFYISFFGLILLSLFPFIDFKGKNADFNFKEYLVNTQSALKNIKILELFLLIFLAFMVYYGLISYFPTIMSANFSLTSSKIGIFLFITAIGASFSSFILAYLSQKFSLATLLLLTGVFYFISQAFMLVSIPLILYCIPLIFAGFAQGFCVPIINKEIASTSPENHATLLPLTAAVFRAGQTITPFMYAFAWSLYNWEGIYYSGMLLSFIFICIAYIYFKQSKKMTI